MLRQKKKHLILFLCMVLLLIILRSILATYSYYHPGYAYPYTYTGILRGSVKNHTASSREEWSVKYVIEKWVEWEQTNDTEGKRFFFRDREIVDLAAWEREAVGYSLDPGHIHIGEITMEYIGDARFLVERDNNLIMEISIEYPYADPVTLAGEYDPATGHLVDNEGNTLYIVLPSNIFLPKDENLENYDAWFKIDAYSLHFSGRIEADSWYKFFSIDLSKRFV